MVIGVAIPAHLVVLYALLARPDRVTHTTRTATVETTSVISFPPPPIMAPAEVAPIPAPRACPAPNRKATNSVIPDLPYVDGVYASPTNVDWLVAWNEASVYSSTDGGRSFHEVLAGKGRVLSATIDCFGTVIAARGTEIGIHGTGDTNGAETWRTVPGIDFSEVVHESGWAQPPEIWLVGGGSDIVVVGFELATDVKSRVAVSRDLGRTWSFHDIHANDFQGGHFAARQRADGVIELELEIVDCGGTWLETFTIENGSITRFEDPSSEDEEVKAALRARIVKRDPWRDTTASIDATGRAWIVACGAVQLRTAKPIECAEDGDGAR